MDHQHAAFGVLMGASSLLVGYVLHRLSEMRMEELSYLQHVPKFSDFKKLRNHLSNIPDKTADVLVEGTTKKSEDTLKSEKAGVEGAAKLVTTTSYKKVYHAQTEKWSDVSNTIENLNISVPFNLVDANGNTIRVQSVHNAGGFRQILERVWQEKVNPESRSIGDHVTNVALQEIPNGSLTREFLLVFGTSMGAYGTASLKDKSLLSSGNIYFTPVEVSSSIQSLLYRNEMIISTLKFFSFVLLVGGGGILLLSAVPLILRTLGYDPDRSQRAVDN